VVDLVATWIFIIDLKRIFTIFLILSAGTGMMAQQFELTHKVDSFGVSIRTNLAKIHTPKALATGKNLESMWPSLDTRIKTTIALHTTMMIEKKYRINPFFIDYFSILDLAKTKAQIDDLAFSQLLEVTGKMIEFHSDSELSVYLSTLNDFFQYNALYFGKSNQVLFHDGSYSFAYHGDFNQSIDFDMNTAEFDDEYDEYVDDEYDDYNDDEYDDEYDDEENDGFSEEEETNEEPKVEYFPDMPLPLSGPVITFTNTNIEIVSKWKQARISSTNGSFIIFQHAFSGDGGSIDWGPGGLEEKATVSLQTYNFDVQSPNLSAKDVTLNYPEKLDQPIQGEFEYNGDKGVSGIEFISYKSDISHSNQGIKGLSITGGFSLTGSRVRTMSKQKNFAVLSMSEAGVSKFKAISSEFTIEDSTIRGFGSRTTLYHGTDSIYHPSAQLRFDTRTRDLVVKSIEGNYRYAPFYSSYVKMEIKADMVRWDLDSDSLEFSIISGKAELPALIQSIEYYNPEVLSSFGKSYNFNPIILVTAYVSKTHIRQFFPEDIADYNLLNAKEVKASMKELAHHGYLNFNKFTGKYSLQKKAVHYSMAKRNKVDFDNLLLISKVSNGPNIIFDMERDVCVWN